jgi:hypothetical protein
VKALQQQKKTQLLPEEVGGFAFVGKHAHDTVLGHLLSFIEFLIVQSNMQVPIGIPNIDTLWQIFVHQPNFSSDQNLFLKWVNLYREN